MKLLSALDYDAVGWSGYASSFSPRDHDTLKKLDWSESKARRIIRSLYGIFEIDEEEPWHYHDKTCYHHFHIPEENTQSVRKALGGDGRFLGEVEIEDIPVLKAVYKRDKELKSRYGCTWNPRFYPTEVARRSHTTKGKARKSLDRLVGVLARTSRRYWKDVTIDDAREVIMIYRPQWFLPTARVPQAEHVFVVDHHKIVDRLKTYFTNLEKKGEESVFDAYEHFSHSELRRHLEEWTDVGEDLVQRTIEMIEEAGPQILEEILSI
ncbi:MAG: hypothetical protein KAU24_02340 [Candidatus Aenigmarchaeota archaeon]|nr:hypothetical protein [Candidatus Aenigmarchaeota archaeon]